MKYERIKNLGKNDSRSLPELAFSKPNQKSRQFEWSRSRGDVNRISRFVHTSPGIRSIRPNCHLCVIYRTFVDISSVTKKHRSTPPIH